MTMQLAVAMAVLLASWTPPEQYHTEHFTFRYSRAAAGDAVALAKQAERVRLRIVSDLGRAPPSPTVVVVTATRAEFRRAQPGRPLPGWVAGVAYSHKNLIILGPGPDRGRRADRNVLFAHEYSHVALAHATRFRRLPKWFVEGFADLQAMAPYAGDPRSWSGRGALPLQELHRNLGHDKHRASQSYQQSYDLVRFLRSLADTLTFRRFIRLLAQGIPFERALKEVYNITPDQLSTRWQKKWNWERVVVPMVTSGLFLWVLAAVLLILGFIRKRRERLRTMAAMEDYEDVHGVTDVGPGPQGDGAGPNGSGGSPLAEIPGGPRSPPPVASVQGFDVDVEGDLEGEDAYDVAESPLLLISFSTVVIGTVMALLLTGLFTLIWPHTRLWLLAGPAVVVTFGGLRWLFSK
jgi:Peptidase MA superfamily